MFNQDQRQVRYSNEYGLVIRNKLFNYFTKNGHSDGVEDADPIPQNADTVYAKALLDIINYGQQKSDRTGTGTRSLFGYQMRFSLLNEFPLITTKKVHFKSVVGELLWFLSGCKGGVKGLRDDYGVNIWNEWDNGKKIAYKNMVEWLPKYKLLPYVTEPINQLQIVIDQIKASPDSRRHVVSNWNASEVHKGQNALDPCHVLFQFYVSNGLLSCEMYQRSADAFLGLPFNIASYALLTKMVAKECGLHTGELIISLGDMHIYNNHMEQVKEQLSREPMRLPTVKLLDVPSFWQYKPSDIQLIGYNPHPAIKGDVSV